MPHNRLNLYSTLAVKRSDLDFHELLHSWWLLLDLYSYVDLSQYLPIATIITFVVSGAILGPRLFVELLKLQLPQTPEEQR